MNKRFFPPKATGIFNNGEPIFPYNALKLSFTKHGNSESVISFRFHKGRCFTLSAQKLQDTKEQTMNILAMQRLKAWSERKDPLWWSCLAHPDIGKSTIRSHHSRRVRVAFVESLRKKGYDKEGSPIPGMGVKEALVGTAMLGAMATTSKAKHDVLVEQTDAIVQFIIKQQSWSQPDGGFINGRGTRSPRPEQRNGERQEGRFQIKKRYNY